MKKPASVGRRLLSLPGLRKYGQQLAVLERRASELKTKLALARAELEEERTARRDIEEELDSTRDAMRAARRAAAERVEALHGKIASLRPRVVRTEALEHLLPARREALLRSERMTEARTRATAFAATSRSYAVQRRADGMPFESAEADCYGISVVYPTNDQDTGSLSARLRRGWLPLAEIATLRTAVLGPVMLDIGANVGTTALPRVILGDAQMILAAEPDPANYACLVRNVIANGLEGLVLPDRVALSDQNGESVLVRGGHMGTHHLTDIPVLDADERVRTMTLDSWLRQHHVDAASVGFVKCDTQGWESKVLSGAQSLLAQPHVVWEVELHPGLVSRSGVKTEDFLQMLAGLFSFFIDLRGDDNRLRPTSELTAALDYLVVRGEQVYTDLILFGANSRN